MFIERSEIGRLDFPQRDTLESTHWFLKHFANRRGMAVEISGGASLASKKQGV